MWKKLKCDAEASFGCSLASNLTEGKTKESDGFDYCSGAGTKLATLTTLARHSHKQRKIKNMRNANVVMIFFMIFFFLCVYVFLKT